MSLQAVGFDLDETLIYTDTPREKILSEVTAKHNLPDLSRQAYRNTHRRTELTDTRQPIFEVLLDTSLPESDPATVTKTYRKLVAESVVDISGCAGLLTQLAERFAIGLLTNGPSRAQQSKLSQFCWRHHFDTILIEGDLGYGKPDFQAFDALLEELNTTPDETIYVGNEIETDIRGASEVGLRTVQVTYPEGPDPSSLADAHVPRKRLAKDLHGIIGAMEP